MVILPLESYKNISELVLLTQQLSHLINSYLARKWFPNKDSSREAHPQVETARIYESLN